jgi:hypothetical protein
VGGDSRLATLNAGGDGSGGAIFNPSGGPVSSVLIGFDVPEFPPSTTRSLEAQSASATGELIFACTSARPYAKP